VRSYKPVARAGNRQNINTAGDLMKTHLLSAIAASTLLASVSPTFAQFTAAEAVEQSRAMQTDVWSARRKAAVRRTREEPATIGSFFSKIFSPAAAENGSPAASGGRSRAAARSRSPAASGNGSSVAPGGRAYESLIASHASSNGVPAELVHRIVMRESRYRPNAVGRGGASGLMQIKLATARGMGYTGSAAGLLDPETNLTYGVRYLAGAYRAAGGNHGRAVGYYASGYYYAAKRQRVASTAYAEAQPAAAPTTMMVMMTTSGANDAPIGMQREMRRKKQRQ
jgi:soluble lytic murein transglycosylase-like protein